MEQRTLVKWLKILVLFAAVCGLGLAGGVLPLAGQWLVESYPEFSYCFWPWLIFLWVLSAPCFMALYLAWKIFENIEKDHAFTLENAAHMGRISFLAAADAVVLLVGNVLFWLIGMNHPGILLLCFAVTLIGIGFSVAAEALSHLIRKAADLQDQSDWTI